MKTIYLINKEGKEILGSDGIMKIDGRYNLSSTVITVRERNKRYMKNFPHLIASGFMYKNTNRIHNI